jgi:hypothetical protein
MSMGVSNAASVPAFTPSLLYSVLFGHFSVLASHPLETHQKLIMQYVRTYIQQSSQIQQ